MNVVMMKYRLSDTGRKSALLAGEDAREWATREEEIADLTSLGDVITVTASGDAMLDADRGYAAFDAPPTVGQVADAIRARRIETAAIEAEAQRRCAARDAAAQQRRLAAEAELLANPAGRWEVRGGSVFIAGCVTRFDPANPAHVEALRRQEADTAAEVVRQAERDALAAQNVEEQAAFSRSFVAAHCDENAQARHDASLLPRDELLSRIADWVFEPLAEFPLYEKITAEEVCECEYDRTDAHCASRFSSAEATSATNEEWETLLAIREAIANYHAALESYPRMVPTERRVEQEMYV